MNWAESMFGSVIAICLVLLITSPLFMGEELIEDDFPLIQNDYNCSYVDSKLEILSDKIDSQDFVCEPYIFVDSCAGSFEGIMANVANINDYKLDFFDCDQFSQEFVSELRSAGFKDAYVYSVTVDCDSGRFNPDTCYPYKGRHLIARIGNSIFIEPTSGKIIMPKEYADYNIVPSLIS